MHRLDLRKILKLFKANFYFKKPFKKDIIIFDKVGSEVIQSYLKGKALVLEVRLESINIFILLKTILNFKSDKSALQNYIFNFIVYVNPKFIVTHIDNNEFFFELKKSFPKIKFIAIQNGLSLAGFSEEQVNLKSWYLDYFFVYSDSYKLAYQKFVEGKIINIGSLINNEKKISTNKEKQIIFISQYRKKIKNNKKFYRFKNKDASWEEFYFAEKKVIEFLSSYCLKKDIKLCIAGVYDRINSREKEFYENIIGNISKKLYWEYKPKIDKWNSYNLIDKSLVVVFVDSALGYQSLARKNKTVSFSIRSQYLNNPRLKFGWPSSFEEEGPFWSNLFNENKFEKILNNIVSLPKKDWENLLEKYQDRLLNYDPGNLKFKDILNKVLHV